MIEGVLWQHLPIMTFQVPRVLQNGELVMIVSQLSLDVAVGIVV
jgi:hypothetical protein